MHRDMGGSQGADSSGYKATHRRACYRYLYIFGSNFSLSLVGLLLESCLLGSSQHLKCYWTEVSLLTYLYSHILGSSDTTLKTWKGKTCLHTFQGHAGLLSHL